MPHRAEEEASATATGPVLQLVMAAAVIPHPDKAHYGGEDAHFVTTDGAGALGVCDGVGGWASDGLSSRDYALELLARCQERLPPSAKADEVGEGLRSSMFHAHSQVRHAAAPVVTLPVCASVPCAHPHTRFAICMPSGGSTPSMFSLYLFSPSCMPPPRMRR